jgi:hypothetical protein
MRTYAVFRGIWAELWVGQVIGIPWLMRVAYRAFSRLLIGTMSHVAIRCRVREWYSVRGAGQGWRPCPVAPDVRRVRSQRIPRAPIYPHSDLSGPDLSRIT